MLPQQFITDLITKVTDDKMLMNMLSQDALNVLSKIEELSPNLEKLLDHQKALVQLFTNEQYQINKNCAEINQKCQLYLEQFEDEEYPIDEQPMSQFYANNDFTIQNSEEEYDQEAMEYNTTNIMERDFLQEQQNQT